jgi:hypothetical protein
MEGIRVKPRLLEKLIFRYLAHIENEIENWSPTPSRGDEYPIDELYGYINELDDILELSNNHPKIQRLRDKIEILIGQ